MAFSKTVVVLGASYGGAHAAKVLSQTLPAGWRVVAIERNSHMNHLYVLPRFAVLPGHEYKAFVPLDRLFSTPSTPSSSTPSSSSTSLNEVEAETVSPHLLIHAEVASITPHSVTLSRPHPALMSSSSDGTTLEFDYLIYALGSHLPAPINLWAEVPDELADVSKAGGQEEDDSVIAVHGTKAAGIAWLRRFQRRVERARSILIVGGGALGIQYATDIAEMYPGTRITLLHSRARLMPKFEGALHGEVMSTLQALNVQVVLNDRLDFSSLPTKRTAPSSVPVEKTVRTQHGRELSADLILLCTGQTPNTSIMRAALPDAVGPTGEVKVLRTLQIAMPIPPPPPPAPISSAAACFIAPECPSPSPSTTASSLPGEWEPSDAHLYAPHPHMFAIGDAADAWGALKAGHNAYFQAEVAVRNVLRLIKREMRVPSSPPARQNEIEADELPFFWDNEEDVDDSNSESEPEAEEEEELERYLPGPPAIKLSVGLTQAVYQINGQVGRKEGMNEDLDALLMWAFYGHEGDIEEARA